MKKAILVARHLVTAAAAAAFVLIGINTAYASTRIDTPTDLYWSNKTGTDDDDANEGSIAHWDEPDDDEGIKEYEIYLYRDGSKISGSYKTKKTYYNFKAKLSSEGDYTFKVRAISKNKNYTTSVWSGESESFYVNEETAEFYKNGGVIDTQNSGPGSTSATGEWVQDSVGWWFKRADGTYPSNGWFQDAAGTWYYMNESGYMVTGWQEVGGKYYYLSSNGAMVTGSQEINGVKVEFGADGALIGDAVPQTGEQEQTQYKLEVSLEDGTATMTPVEDTIEDTDSSDD